MAKYAYPAVFTAENNSYSVSFPDVEGCLTFGETIPEAIEMAEDALCLMLYDLEEEGSEIPKPSDAKELKVESNEFVTMIACDTVEYRKFYDNKAVKKNSDCSELDEHTCRKSWNKLFTGSSGSTHSETWLII